jgi:2-polyprenyl-6-methoxyphenol hydroxylase-like FAD-dependent oxidoreductase
VLVVGGGPVGLTLAIDLAQRGIDVAVAEIRAGGEVPGIRLQSPGGARQASVAHCREQTEASKNLHRVSIIRTT